MGTDRRWPRCIRAGLGLALGVAAMLPAGASASAQQWWQPLAFAGQRVDAVSTTSTSLVARVGADVFVSRDGGGTFTRLPATGAATLGLPASPSVTAGARTWTIRDGVMLTGPSGAALVPDAAAPFLGRGARLLAAPAATPGVVVAVGTDGHVWRRGQDGRWATAFVLLPGGGLSGAPAVTSVAAFSEPLSTAVYLGTDGYGVLVSSDGGDDWIRADAGLPLQVLGLATRPESASLYAATGDGLWVHRLQAFPAPPSYRDAALYLRWLGIVLVAVAAALGAALALRVGLPAAEGP